MIEPLAKFMDWWAIQAATLMMPANDLNSRLEEALQFLKGPDFIPVESQPARVEFDGARRFRFPTPRPCEFAENNVVHGRLYRTSEQWQQRPVIILLPGWNDSATYKLRFPLIARRSNRAGFNVATLVPPYHFQRCPRQRREFDRGDCLQLAHGTAQALAEIRAFTGWLQEQGCPAVGLWGYSLGALHAGMAVCHDARFSSVVLAGDHGRTTPCLEQRAVRPRIRANFPRIREICEALNRTPMNLTTTRPVIPRENILLIEGIHDLICPKDDIEDLWQSWGRPDIWRLPHGHFAVCCGLVPGLPGRVLRWLTPRLNAPTGQIRPTETATTQTNAKA
jgi:pimeloyl-ACP methyl ester carboxylesterase